MSKLILALVALVLFAEVAKTETGPDLQQGWNARKQVSLLANGQRIAWVEMGRADAPPLVLLHGWTDSSRSWTGVAPLLAERHRLILVDLRGHGQSAAPACCYTLNAFAEDVTLLMDRLGIARAAVAGHSLGSLVAQRLAFRDPARVERLILIGSTGLSPVTKGDALWEGAHSLKSPLVPEANPFLAVWLEQVAMPSDPAFAPFARAEVVAVPLQVWAGVIREVAEPALRKGASLPMPVLILAGGEDEMFGADHQAALRAAIPHARYRLFPALGHNSLWEDPQAVAAAMSAFLAS